jgi:hypothetical protein
MDDFHHRLLVALERLSGRGDDPDLGARLEAVQAQVGELILVRGEIRARLPPAGP